MHCACEFYTHTRGAGPGEHSLHCACKFYTHTRGAHPGENGLHWAAHTPSSVLHRPGLAQRDAHNGPAELAGVCELALITARNQGKLVRGATLLSGATYVVALRACPSCAATRATSPSRLRLGFANRRGLACATPCPFPGPLPTQECRPRPG